jgi:2-polyprenyl-3-methyl-5-hydroxy-6-metoxy-1,4-benzoquinol methylase
VSMTTIAKFNLILSKIGKDILNIDLLKNKFKLFFEKFESDYSKLIDKLKNLKETNYNLGLFHYNNGFAQDTIFRFKIIKTVWPNVPEVDYFIGRSYLELSKTDKAKKYIDLYLSSEDKKFIEEADFCSSIINNKSDSIKKIPLTLIKRYSDIMSRLHESIEIKDNHSDQEQLLHAISSLLTERGKPFSNSFLDIGCGSGTIAGLIRESKSAGNVEGIDISERIVDISSKKLFESKPIYNTVTVIDFDSFIGKCNNSYDVIIASRFLDYYTNLTKFLDFCKKHLNKKGVIGFTVKTSDISQLYEIIPSLEEFTFNFEEVKRSIADSGLILENTIEITFPDGYKGHCFIITDIY